MRLGGFPEVDQLVVPGGTACGHGSGGIPSSWFRPSPFSAWSIRASYNHPSTWNSSLKLCSMPTCTADAALSWILFFPKRSTPSRFPISGRGNGNHPSHPIQVFFFLSLTHLLRPPTVSRSSSQWQPLVGSSELLIHGPDCGWWTLGSRGNSLYRLVNGIPSWAVFSCVVPPAQTN